MILCRVISMGCAMPEQGQNRFGCDVIVELPDKSSQAAREYKDSGKPYISVSIRSGGIR